MIDPTVIGWQPPPAAVRSRGRWRRIGQFWAVLGAALVLMTGTALAFELSVDREPTSVEAPAGEVTYTVTIECDQDPCVVSTLTDSTGNLLGGGPCGGISASFTVDDPYECSYTRDVTGTAGTVNTNEVSATGTEAGNAEDDNDTTSVAIVAPSTTPPPTTPPATQDPTPAQIRARVNAKIDAAFQRLGLPSRREIFGDALRAEIRDRLNDRIG